MERERYYMDTRGSDRALADEVLASERRLSNVRREEQQRLLALGVNSKFHIFITANDVKGDQRAIRKSLRVPLRLILHALFGRR